MSKTIILSGGNGPERTEFIKKYIDTQLNNGQLIIYDYTYALIVYNQYDNVSYYCIDTCLSYINNLEKILKEKKDGNNDPIYIITDAYGGLMFQSNMKKPFIDFLQNKDSYNINILMSCRHLEYIPEEMIKLFDEVIEYKDINGILSNDYFKNLK